MKSNQAINQLFDHARELPAEIQLEQVEIMISSLPLAAAGLSWIYKIYLKSLFMPSVSVIVVAGSVLVMTGLPKEDIQTQAAIPGTTNVISYFEVAPEEIPAGTIMLDTLEQPQPNPNPEPTPEPSLEPSLEPSPSPVPSVEPLSESVEVIVGVDGVREVHEKGKVKPTKDKKKEKETKVKADKEVKEKKKEKSPKEQKVKADKEEKVKAKVKAKAKEDKSASEPFRSIASNITSDHTINISEKGMMRLKRTLYKELASDQLISTKKATVLLKFMESEIIVNEQKLESGMYAKYKKIMLENGAEPSPDFQVRMSPEYIIVGEFTEEGFKGIGKGRNMELKFITGDEEGFWSLKSQEDDLWMKMSDDGGLFKEDH